MSPILVLYDWLVEGVELDPRLINRKALADAALHCAQPADGSEKVLPSPIVDGEPEDKP